MHTMPCFLPVLYANKSNADRVLSIDTIASTASELHLACEAP